MEALKEKDDHFDILIFGKQLQALVYKNGFHHDAKPDIEHYQIGGTSDKAYTKTYSGMTEKAQNLVEPFFYSLSDDTLKTIATTVINFIQKDLTKDLSKLSELKDQVLLCFNEKEREMIFLLSEAIFQVPLEQFFDRIMDNDREKKMVFKELSKLAKYTPESAFNYFKPKMIKTSTVYNTIFPFSTNLLFLNQECTRNFKTEYKVIQIGSATLEEHQWFADKIAT